MILIDGSIASLSFLLTHDWAIVMERLNDECYSNWNNLFLNHYSTSL